MDNQAKIVVDAIVNVIDRSVQSMKDIASAYNIDSTSYVRITEQAATIAADLERKIADRTGDDIKTNQRR